MTVACSLQSSVTKSYKCGIINVIRKSRVVCALVDYQWCGEICFAEVAISKDSCPPRIPMLIDLGLLCRGLVLYRHLSIYFSELGK